MQSKRIIGWSLIALVVALLVAAIAGYFYLRSNRFQQFVLHKIVEQANSATGGKTEIGGLEFSLSSLTGSLTNITVRGKEGPDQPPLLHADKLTVRVKIISALRREVSLRELLIDHPVVHLQVNSAGENNLPAPPPSQSSSNTTVFELAVGHVQLTKGEIDYSDKKIPLEAELFDLGTDIRFVPSAKRYEGELTYKNGRVDYAQYTPLAHNFAAKFIASPDRFDLEPGILNVGSSVVTVRAHATNYSNPVVDGDYQIQIHTQDLASLEPTAKPAGDVSIDGKLHYQTGSQPVLRSISIDGKITSEILTAAAAGRRVELRKLQGNYQLAGGRLSVKNLSLESLGGRVTADLDMKQLDTTPQSLVHVAFHNISLRAVQQTLRRQELKDKSVSGSLNGKAEAGWEGSISTVRATTDLILQARASSNKNPSSSEVPVNGMVHAAYDGSRQAIAVRQTSIRIPSATLTAQGEISDHSSLQLQLAANDLHQLVALVSSFGTSPGAPPIAVSGSAMLNADVKGSMKKPAITGHLNAQNLNLQGSEWTSVKLDIRASPSGFSVQNGSLVNARHGQATFSGTVALRDWAYQSSNAIAAELNVQQLQIAELQRLANQQYPITGDLSAKVSLGGSQLNPVGSGTARIANAQAYNEPIQNLSLQFNTVKKSIVSTLNVSARAGTVDANLSYTPSSKAYKVHLTLPSLVLQNLQTVEAKTLAVNGSLSASVDGEGTLDDPRLDVLVQMPQLQVRDKSISGLKAEVHVANHAADLRFDSKVSESSVQAHGRIALNGDYYTEAAIDTSTIPLEVLMATYGNGAPEGFAGQTELHASFKGPLKQASQIESHLTIPVLHARYQSLEVGIEKPLHADYSNSVVTLQPAEIRGTDTSLRLQGQMPVGGSGSGNLSAQGSVDMRILKLIAPDMQSSGIVTLDVSSSGSMANPTARGQVQFKDVALAVADAPVGIEKLNGTLDISNDHVQVSKLTCQVGGGQVSFGGSIAYRPSLQFNVALQGQSIRLRYPDGLKTLLDANLAINGNTQASTLKGRVLVNSLSFTPDFDLSTFGEQFGNETTVPAQPGFADTIKLAVGVQSPESLNATSSQVSFAGRIALQVGGTAANPVITGRTNLTSGELFYRNLRYQLQRGVITFDDPNETHPVMNLSVATTVEQYNLTLSMRGPLDKLTTSYVSDPPLSTADIINLIARGKTTQESAASSQSTDSMIASQAASQLSGSVQKLAGISSLQIDPSLGGNSQNPSARVAIQQRVTKNLLFSFSTDVSQPGSEVVQGEYDINKRWSVSMTRDQLGGVSVDGKYHTKF